MRFRVLRTLPAVVDHRHILWIPEGSLVEVQEYFGGKRLVKATTDGKAVELFFQDLVDRGIQEPPEPAVCSS